MGFLRRRVVSSSLNGRQGFSCCSVSPELAPSADRILDSKRKIPPAAEYSVTFHLEPLTGSKFLFWVIFSSSRYQPISMDQEVASKNFCSQASASVPKIKFIIWHRIKLQINDLLEYAYQSLLITAMESMFLSFFPPAHHETPPEWIFHQKIPEVD